MPTAETPPPVAPAGRTLPWRRFVPRTLFARVTLVMVLGLAAAQLLAFAAARYERELALRELMMAGIERDIASSVAMLDRLPAAERAAWLARLERRNYRFALSGQVEGPAPGAPALRRFGEAIVGAVRPFEVTRPLQALAAAADRLGP